MNKKDAEEFLISLDRYSFVDTISILRKEESELLHFSDDGVVVKLGDGLVSIASLNWKCILKYIDPDFPLCTVHDESLRNYMVGELGYQNEEGCLSFSWWGDVFPSSSFDIKRLTSEYAHVVAEAYYPEGEEWIGRNIEKGLLYGLFENGELAAFAGFHREGSMGMLHVLGEYRRKGYGEALEKFVINRALSAGSIPYCHVYTSNNASIQLQRKLGLTEGMRPVWWLWKD